MNSNFFQTLMTVFMILSTAGSGILVSLGCTQNVITGALDCTEANAPVWLIPWLVGAAALIGVLKMFLAAFEGKLTAPTVALPKNKSPSQ